MLIINLEQKIKEYLYLEQLRYREYQWSRDDKYFMQNFESILEKEILLTRIKIIGATIFLMCIGYLWGSC